MDLLVHISASTTKKDDDRYRAQALAYINFEPKRVLETQAVSSEPTFRDSFARKRKQDDINPGQHAKVRISQGAVSSPNRTRFASASITEDSALSLTVVRTPLQRLEHIQANWRRQQRSLTAVEHVESSSTSPTSLLPPPNVTDSRLVEDSQIAAEILQSSLPEIAPLAVPRMQPGEERETIQVPESIFTLEKQIKGIDSSNIETSGSTSSHHSQTQSRTEKPEVIIATRDRDGKSLTENQSTLDIDPSCSPSKDKTAAAAVLAKLASLPRSIESPGPEVDSGALDADGLPTSMDAVTTALDSNPQLRRRYRPAWQTRSPLRRWERGFWRIDTHSWPLAAQVDFWHFLGRFVSLGRAGFATRCERNDDGGFGVEQGPLPQELGIVRVYCWGEIVRPVYLLILLGSLGKVRGTGAQWISASNEIVITIP